MTAFNVVRYRAKPGREQALIDAHKRIKASLPGVRSAHLIKTGDRSFCFIAEWDDVQNIVNARPQMIAILDEFRDLLENLGHDLGVTDPVSGPAVVEIAL